MSKIEISTSVAKPLSVAWDAYLLPELIVKWNFASPDWHCPSSSNDVRVGGIMKSRMEAKDGSFGFDFEATYTEVIPHKKLAYALGDKRNVEIYFSENAGKTDIKIAFDPETVNDVEMQRAGWQAILDNYRKHAESL